MNTKWRISLSFLIATGFLVFSYWVTNLRFAISGESALLSKIELLRQIIHPKPVVVIDSVLFINVQYDKELSPVKDDDYQIPEGKTAITDRKKLIRLLQFLHANNSYRYILLDVFFGDDIETVYDRELFTLIRSMPRIIIPFHQGKYLADSTLMEKAGLADYITTFSHSYFIKYPYLNDTEKSLPVKMYEEITHRGITKKGIFYFDDNRLARSSIVLNYELTANRKYDDYGNKMWYNLGMDLLDDSIPEYNVAGDSLLYSCPDLTRNKYIIIGTLGIDDSHATFLGSMPGALINFNAFISLVHGRHIVSIPLFICLFIVFWIMTYLTLSRQTIAEFLRLNTDGNNNKRITYLNKVLSMLCSWVGYSVIMSIMCITTYFTMKEVYDIFITSTMFSIFNRIVTFLNRHNKKIYENNIH